MDARPLISCGLAALALLGGCREAASPTIPAGAAASAAPAPDDEERALALAAPDGDGPVEKLLRERQAAAEKLPTKPDNWVLVGQAWVQKARVSGDPGFHLNADAAAAIALRLAPDFRPALSLRGMVFLNDHRFAEARDLARRILQKDPDDPMTLGVLSDALLELGDIEGSMDAAQKMVDHKPDLPSYSRASYLRWLQGDVEGARQAIRSAFDAQRGSKDHEPGAWVLVQAALMFWHEGDYEGADAGLAMALKYQPDYAPALKERGRVALSLGRAADAVGYLRRSLDRSPNVETAWLLAEAQQAAGDADAARATREQVVRLGRQMDARTLSLFLASTGGDAAEALKLADGERAKRGGPYTDDAYAWALLHAGRAAEAAPVARRMVALGTRDARLWYHAGAILLAAGDASGREWLQKALALNPAFDPEGVADAKRLLAAGK
jgi:tetratricopeptide (TPR) repeat protein